MLTLMKCISFETLLVHYTTGHGVGVVSIECASPITIPLS